MMRRPWIFVVTAALVASVSFAGPPLPPTPAGIDDLLYARPFRLDEGFRFRWSAEQPTVSEGFILILDVPADLVYPRETAEPVLYVGGQPAERINRAYPSGRLIALVPGPVDLGTAPIWFGAPELPERVDARMAGEETARAAAAGIVAPARTVVDAATARGGSVLAVRDHDALQAALFDLYREWVAPLQDAVGSDGGR
jgi:hypothetical protein